MHFRVFLCREREKNKQTWVSEFQFRPQINFMTLRDPKQPACFVLAFPDLRVMQKTGKRFSLPKYQDSASLNLLHHRRGPDGREQLIREARSVSTSADGAAVPPASCEGWRQRPCIAGNLRFKEVRQCYSFSQRNKGGIRICRSEWVGGGFMDRSIRAAIRAVEVSREAKLSCW